MAVEVDVVGRIPRNIRVRRQALFWKNFVPQRLEIGLSLISKVGEYMEEGHTEFVTLTFSVLLHRARR